MRMNKFFLKTLIPAAALFVLLPGCVRAVRAEGGGLSLPTAGLSYALSQPDTRASVKDVEDYLTASGMIRTRKGDAAKTSDEKKQDKSAQQTKSGSAVEVPEVTEIVDTALTKKQQREADVTVSQTAILIEETAAAAGREIDDSYSKEVVAVAKAVESAPEGATTEEAVSIAKEEVVLAQRAEDAGVTVEEMRRADEEAAKAAERAKAEEELGAKRAEAEAAVAEEELCVALVSDFINIRSEPSTDSEIVGKLYANGVAKVLSEPDDFGWMKISSGEVVGYIKAEYVATGQYAHELAAEVEEYRATVNTETLRVRVAPDLDSDVITLIGMGEELNILEELAGWLKVDTPDGEGYISSDYADVDVFFPEAKSKAQEEAEIAEARRAEEEKIKAQKAQAEADRKKREAEAARTAAERERLQAEAQRAQEAADAAKASYDQAAEAAAAAGAGAGGSGKGQEVVNYACQFIGNPYVWGGSSLTNGTDCSGFTMSVYAHFGVSLPHYDASQRSCGTAVASLAEARPGDLICYNGHVGIYMGGGQIVHASNPRTGITTGNATYRPIVAIRRIFN